MICRDSEVCIFIYFKHYGRIALVVNLTYTQKAQTDEICQN